MKKREKYGTVMIDAETHRIIDMIDSRDQEVVEAWLKTYPNLEIVARDGSITYHNAITEAHPEAVQVSDRFHIFKNLTEYASDVLKKELKNSVTIPVDEPRCEVTCIQQEDIPQSNINRKLTLEEKYERALQYQADGKRKSWICPQLNMDIRTYDKLINLQEEEKQTKFKKQATIIHEEKVQKKMNDVNEVRELKKLGLSNMEISRRTGFDRRTVKRYLDESFTPVYASYGKKRSSILDPCKEEIKDLFELGLMSSKIEGIIRKKGYNGSSSSVRHYVCKLKQRKQDNPQAFSESDTSNETIKRSNILKLLYKPLEKVEAITQEQFERVCEKHPIVKIVYDLTWEFKSIFTTKSVGKLDSWIEETKNINIQEFKSFTNGLARDIEAVRNAVTYQNNNGLAEGSINKLKAIKRIMYGRCKFSTLRTKVLLLERMRIFN